MKTANLLRVALAVLALGAAGCTVDKVGTVDLTGVCAWPQTAADCTFSGTCSNYLLGRPFVYTTYSTGASTFYNQLELAVELRNQLVDNSAGDSSGQQTNANDAYVESYEMSFASDSFTGAVPSVTFPATTTRVPVKGTAVGIAIVIPWTAMKAISDQLTAQALPNATVQVSVRAKGSFGSTGSGRSFESGTINLLVDVIDATAGAYTCSGTDVVKAVCPPDAVGQYASVDCGAP